MKIANAYFEAMANRDVEMIISLSADDVNCISTAGELKGTTSFHGFHERFAQMLSKFTLVDAFGNDEKAVIIYKADTLPVQDLTAVEYITVKNGKIVTTESIYDATPFAQYRAAQARH
ncbi:ketosteroid isomerase-like protein [Fontibacillus solani]|uniref:Ketosteroid isomerase-like protein n=1 Tax=Fontibacillus solani TaxID=1572857 RepID=A0A7W3XRE1_9BACL|nr:nuclear transport factor 2 family protein [Fontibacillus solani]MBA9085562.1 ketosteroid isomerase-like protein [Fontibacillus solani]